MAWSRSSRTGRWADSAATSYRTSGLKITEFVSRLQRAARTNLRSVVLYGSAASGEFDSDYSDINVLCILGDASLPSLVPLAPVARWWQKQARATPLFLTIEDLGRSAD